MSTDNTAGPAPAATEREPRAMPRWHVRQGDIVVLAVTVILFGGGLGWWFSQKTHQWVWLVNELDVPVTVELGGTTTALASGTKMTSKVPSGVQPVRVRLASGRVLEESLVAMPAGKDLAVYSVFGAALLYLERIEYTPRESGNGGGNGSAEVYAGERFTAHDDIDYPFEPPPPSITSDSRSGTLVRQHFGIAPGGWDATVGYLNSKGRITRAAELCRDVAQANPENPRAQSCAEVLTAHTEGYDAALAFARGVLERQPESEEAHRGFAYLMRWAGRRDELRAYYQERVKATPDSVLLQAMSARSEPPEIAGPRLIALLAGHPDNVFVRRSAAWASSASGHLMEAERLYAGLQDQPEYDRSVEDHVRTLVALQRGTEAVGLLRKILDAPGKPEGTRLALYAQLVRQPGVSASAPAVEDYIKRLTKGDDDPGLSLWLATLLGTPVEAQALEQIKNENLRTAARIQLAAGQDPKTAWEACAGAPIAALRNLAPEVAVLLGAEFDRAGDPALAATLYEASNAIFLPAAILSEYVNGGQKHPDLEWLDPVHLAALDLARARTFDGLGKPSAALYAAVEKNDALQGIVTRARRAWPALGRGTEQVREVVLTRP